MGRLHLLQPRWEVGRKSRAARRGEVPFAEMSHSREGNLIHLIHDTGDFGCSIANERGCCCCCCSSDISRRKLALWSSLNSLEPSSVHACVVREKSTVLAVELVLQTRSGAALGFGGLYCSLIGKAPTRMESLYMCVYVCVRRNEFIIYLRNRKTHSCVCGWREYWYWCTGRESAKSPAGNNRSALFIQLH